MLIFTLYKKYWPIITFPILLLIIYFFLYKIYIPRVNAFGCFDDCFNIAAGYFITKGKVLYEQIPFNHQRLMADISAIIQTMSNPSNIFDLILKHRQFLLLFGFLMNLLILFRFKFAGFCFILFYEFSKFYIFGDRFLAESFIVYPLSYSIGILFFKLKEKYIYGIDYILISIFTWFVIFSREPFVPTALFLYAFIILGKPFKKYQKISISIFTVLVFLTIAATPIKEYFFDVFYVNKERQLFLDINFKSFIYPFNLFFGGKWNLFRGFLIAIDCVFLIGILIQIIKRKFKIVIILLFILGISNIRYVSPGEIFYSSFHMIPWYGMIIMTAFLMIVGEYKKNKNVAILVFAILSLFFLNFLFSKDSFIREKINIHEEFLTNYGNYLQVGEVINALSFPKDTLFVDGFDEIIYWTANRESPYKYSWYTSFMPNFMKFKNARLEMFIKNPPDFYYGSCPKDENPFRILPAEVKNQYIRLNSNNNPTCVYVKKMKVSEISESQWAKAKEFLYTKPY